MPKLRAPQAAVSFMGLLGSLFSGQLHQPVKVADKLLHSSQRLLETRQCRPFVSVLEQPLGRHEVVEGWVMHRKCRRVQLDLFCDAFRCCCRLRRRQLMLRSKSSIPA